MIRHPGPRSSAARVLVGGALAAALGGASAAWACSPGVTLKINDGLGDVLSGPVDSNPAVVISVTYPESVAPAGTTVVIVSDASPLAAAVATGTETTATYTDKPTVIGYYYYYSYVLGLDGKVVSGTLKDGGYAVTPPAVEATGPEAGTPTPEPARGPVNNGPADPGPVGTPNPGAGPNVVPPAPNPAAQQPGAPTGVPAPAPGRPAAAAPATAPAALDPTAPSAPRPASDDPASAAPAAQPSSPSVRQLLPEASDLWSGLANGAAPGLDAPLPAQKDDGLPVGAGLLGIGVVALAGVGLAAGQRRLALARRRRS